MTFRAVAALGGALALALSGAPISNAAVLPLAKDHIEHGSPTFELAKFRTNLDQKVREGAPDASTERWRFDALSPSQLTQFSLYLTGDIDPFASIGQTSAAGSGFTDTRHVQHIGDFQLTAETNSDIGLGSQGGGVVGPSRLRMAATIYNVHSSYDYTYSFAGVKLIKTRVWADYKTQSGVLKSVTDWACQIVQNYDIQAEVSSTKQSRVLSGGVATFKSYVVSKRGVPTPWGQITTSTRSGYQYMKVNGAGIVSSGWTS